MYRPVVYIRQSQLTSAADQAQHVQDWDNVTPGHCVSRDTNINIFYQYLTPLVTLVTTPAHVGLSSLLSSFPQDVSVMLKLLKRTILAQMRSEDEKCFPFNSVQ